MTEKKYIITESQLKTHLERWFGMDEHAYLDIIRTLTTTLPLAPDCEECRKAMVGHEEQAFAVRLSRSSKVMTDDWQPQ